MEQEKLFSPIPTTVQFAFSIGIFLPFLFVETFIGSQTFSVNEKAHYLNLHGGT